MTSATDTQVRNDCRNAAYIISGQTLQGVDVEVPPWLTETVYRTRSENRAAGRDVSLKA